MHEAVARLGPWVHGCLRGTIHSVFDHAVNIRFPTDDGNARLVTCTAEDERLPDGIGIEAPRFIRLQAGCGRIELTNDTLTLDTLRIHLLRKQIPLIPRAEDARLERISSAAGSICTGMGVPDPSKVRLHLIGTAVYLMKGKLMEAGAEAAKIIGWGPGLTPSADDALVGMMAVLFSRSSPGVFLTGERLSSTTDVSAKYLDCAQRGFFTGRVADLFDPAIDSAQAVSRAADWGASSGRDMLWGMIQTINGLYDI